MPYCVIIGINIGVTIRVMTVVSINIPNTVSIIKISSRSTYLLPVRPTSIVVRVLGSWSNTTP